MLRSTLAILILSMTPLYAEAKDVAAATACADQLGSNARKIYDLAAPDVKKSSVIKDILIAKIKPLVMSGEMDRSIAQADAPKAGECLSLLK